jgi:phage terminase small subunit
MDTVDPLNDRQRKFAEGVACGLTVQQAARQAGFSPSYSRKSSKLLKHPGVSALVATIREQGRTLAAYDLAQAMAQAQKGIDLAEKHKNPMAFIKGCELRAKLSGLLIERTQEVPVDLRGALEEARLRIINPQSDLKGKLEEARLKINHRGNGEADSTATGIA